MDVHYDNFELVRVGPDFRLLDPESYERRYRRTDNVPLDPGLYVVHWPADVAVRRFDEHALYFGPFDLRADADAALDRLRVRLEVPDLTWPERLPI